MESNKFEKSVRDKLKKREIKPSAQSWEKLEAKLDAEKRETSAKSWKYIAAAIAVLLVAGTFLWNPSTSETPQIVEEPVNETFKKPEASEPKNNVQIASEEKKEEEKISAGKKIIGKVASNSKSLIDQEKTPVVPVFEEVKVEEAVVLDEISLEPPVFEEKIIQSKLEEIIAAAAKNDEISEDEIDVLLAEAASELSRERNSQSYTSANRINANTLLAEVEDEIYQSFKAKVFEVLKEGYLKAKTAVANRNY